METRWMYRCPTCGKTYPIEPGRYLCDECAKKQRPDEPLRGVLECAWEGEAPARALPFPVEDRFFPPIPWDRLPSGRPKGCAPSRDAKLWLKDDTCNPSGSTRTGRAGSSPPLPASSGYGKSCSPRRATRLSMACVGAARTSKSGSTCRNRRRSRSACRFCSTARNSSRSTDL